MKLSARHQETLWQKWVLFVKRGVVFGVIFFVFTASASSTFAAVGLNRVIPFQGKVVNKTDGTNITDGTYSFTFKIYDAASSGNLLWQETQSSVSVTSGIFSVDLGSSTAFNGGGYNVDFKQNNLYLDITFNGETFGSRIQLAAVPQAINAEQLDGVVATQSASAFTLTGGTSTPRTLTIAGADITIGSTITPTSAGGLTVQSNGANGLTLDTGGAAGITIGATANAITFGATNNPTYSFNGTGAVTFQGTSFTLGNGSTATLATTGNAGLTLLSAGSGNITLGQNLGNGNVVVQPNAGGQAAFIINDQGFGDIVTASAGGTTRFIVSNSGLTTVAGALRITQGSSITDTFTTPQNSSVTTKINIPLFDPGAFNQIVAMGLPSSANTNARVMSLFDARSGSHQPTLSLFTPDENNVAGFSWEGTNSDLSLKNSVSNGSDYISFGGTNAVGFSAATGITLFKGYGYGGATTTTLFIGAGGTTPNAASLAWGDGTGWKTNFGYTNGSSFVPTISFEDLGRVGIGTTNLLSTLDVRADRYTTPVASISGMTGKATLVIDNSGVGDFLTASSAGATKFVIANSGNVGIGTTRPTENLDVMGSAAGGGINFETAGDIMVGNGSTPSVFFGGNYAYASGDYIKEIAAGSLELFGGGTNAAATQLVINNGSVGIGTTNPLASTGLDIEKNGLGNSVLAVNQTGLGDILTASAAGSTKFVISNSGNVGVGTTAPSASAVLDLTSTTQGFLPPRMTQAQRGSISSPATGLTVFDTSNNQLETYNGSSWIAGGSSTQPAFMVNKNGSNQTVTTSTNVKLTWSNEVYDTNNNFANNKFTPTVAGKYLVTVSARCSDSTSGCIAILYKNGSEINEGTFAGTTGGQTSQVTDLVDMNGSTDYLEAYVQNNGGTTVLGLAITTYFTGTLVNSNSANAGGWTNDGTQSYLIDSTDLVGIGTATPGQQLHVYSNANASEGLRLENANAGASAYAQLELKNADKQFNLGLGSSATSLFPDSFFIYDNTSNIARFLINQYGSTGIGVLSSSSLGNAELVVNQPLTAGDIFSASSSGATKFVINNSGNVGIGTTNPLLPVHIVMNGASSALVTPAGRGMAITAGSAGYDRLYFENTNSTSGQRVFTIDNGNTTGILDFGSLNDAGSAFANQHILSLKYDGSVGIGTTSPLSQTGLDIEKNGLGNAIFVANQTGLGDIFTASASGSTKFVINNAGNVGIGTSSPQARLQVSGGNIRLDNNQQLEAINSISNIASLAYLDSGNITHLADGGNINGWYVGYRSGVNPATIQGDGNSKFIRFYTNNTEQLRIDTNGSVGIGTTSPLSQTGLDIEKNGLGNAIFVANQTGLGDIFTASASGSTKFVINNSGSVGIGTSSPGNLLSVYSSSSGTNPTIESKNDSAVSSYFYTGRSGNASITGKTILENGSSNDILLNPSGGHVGIWTTAVTSGYCFQITTTFYIDCDATTGGWAGANTAMKIAKDSGTGRSINAAGTIGASGTDYAEYFKQAQVGTLERGDIVTIVGQNTVDKAGKGTDPIGVYSSDPSFVGGDRFYDQNHPELTALIGLVGQIPTKVSTENGSIEVGDPLTTSSVPGVAMKATSAGEVIGRAEESFDGTGTTQTVCTDDQTCYPMAKVNTFVGRSWYDPDVYLTSTGDFIIHPNTTPDANYTPTPSYTVTDLVGKALTRVGIFSDATIGNLKAGGITASTISGNGPLVINGDTNLSGLLQGLSAGQNASSDAILALLTSSPVSSDTALSQVVTDRVVAGLDIISPKVTTAEINAQKINITSTDGLTDLLTQISTSSAIVVAPRLEVAGLATVSADLRVKGNGLVEGIFTVIDTLKANNFIVTGISDFFDNVIFHKDVAVQGTVTFNKDTAGNAVIQTNATQVAVTFAKAYTSKPIVTASFEIDQQASTSGSVTSQNALQTTILNGGYTYVVTNVSTKGFTILLNKPATVDIPFSWHALSIDNPTTVESGGGLQLSPSPVASSSAN